MSKDEGEVPKTVIFTSHKESALAHRLLDGLRGIEIGGSAFNPFNIPGCQNVDFTSDPDTVFKREERKLAGSILPVEIVAPGDSLPFDDASLDFVVHSHVLEHFYDPIAAIHEWRRVLRPGGILFMIVPHAERNSDSHRLRTTLLELIRRHEGREDAGADAEHDVSWHHSVWITEDVVNLVQHMGMTIIEVQDIDDKVGNGFAVVARKAAVGNDRDAFALPIIDEQPAPHSIDKVWIGANLPIVPSPLWTIPIHVHPHTSIRLAGWAALPGSHAPASSVVLCCGDSILGTSYYGLSRPDVAALLSNPLLTGTGFTISLSGRELAPGHHELKLRVGAAAGGFYSVATTIAVLVREGP